MAFNADPSISSNNSLEPAHRKINAPAAAGTLDPETGASRNRPPSDDTSRDIRIISSSASVAQSTMDLPSDTPPRTPSPSGAPNTISATSGVLSIVYVTPHASTTSLAVDLISIDLSANLDLRASHFDPVRFHTTRGFSGVPATPSERRRAAMPSPMMPRPTNPTADDDDDIFNDDDDAAGDTTTAAAVAAPMPIPPPMLIPRTDRRELRVFRAVASWIVLFL
mmetsp:Transcript_12448/g.36683  ORF Transcript_12448/g.36683 Transcript_12448/m.36683 type:complete len:223 (-) Transcript_12448:74-742(-)